jgi:hypothetical protein
MSTSPATGAARIGRRIGITAFWLMAVFIVVASSRSVLREIYGLGAGPANADQVTACAGTLQRLERSLREQAALAVRDHQNAATTQRWLAAWDDEYASLGRCGELEDARISLGNLRASTATLLEQHGRRSAPLTERIRRALLRFTSKET